MSDLGNGISAFITVALIFFSAFFVAIEFALVAARRNRLEEAARTSASARAALRSSSDLSMLLAGSQLGITLCVVGLGAVAKPWVQGLITPVLTSWGSPQTLAYVLSFMLALLVVTFLHLVVGEMAPKSWAIAHPERSATLLALPMRGFMWVFRPLLLLLNGAANWCLHRVGVEPVDELAAGRNPETLRQLVDHSVETGALDQDQRDRLVTAMEVDTTALRTLVRPAEQVIGVAAGDGADRIRAAARESGHLRLVVRDHGVTGDPAARRGAADQGIVGVVHVRDALGTPDEVTAAELMRPVLRLGADAPVADAVSVMRQRRTQFALVEDGSELLGLVTMQDLLERLLPDREAVAVATGAVRSADSGQRVLDPHDDTGSRPTPA